MQEQFLDVLFEDNHLLVVNKPAGIATQGAAAGRASLHALAQQYLRRKYRKPGNVYLGVVSRLDSGTSGVVVFARTSKAAARLAEQFRGRSVEKEYWALVEGRVNSPGGEYWDWIVKDERQQRMVIVRENQPGRREARLSYRRLKVLADTTLLEIRLETGRKHQIRVQLASRSPPGWRPKVWLAAKVCRQDRAALPAAGDRASGEENGVGVFGADAGELEKCDGMMAILMMSHAGPGGHG